MNVHVAGTRHAVGRRIAGAPMLLIVASVIGACASRNPRIIPTSSRFEGYQVDEAPSGVPFTPTQPPMTSFNGELPNRQQPGDLVNNPRDFQQFVARLAWHGWLRPRKCKPTASDCPTNAGDNYVIAEAVEEPQLPGLGTLPANVPVVVGKIINVGTHTDISYGIPPRGAAKYPPQYYVIITRRDAQSANQFVARLSIDDDGTPHVDLARINDNGYTICGTHKPADIHGDFKSQTDCARESSMDSDGNGTAQGGAPTGRSVRVQYQDSYAWFPCGEGCCSAQFSLQ